MLQLEETLYASISPWSTKAELMVHVFLNVGHQQGCKLATSGSSVKIKVFTSNVFTIMHYAAAELAGGESVNRVEIRFFFPQWGK